jgi:hypothetical protein
MLVRIQSFGCNWWSRFGHDPGDRYRFTRRAAYYNSTGVRCGNKIRRHWIIPGLIRFNGSGDFNPHLRMRSIGQTFVCTEPAFALGGNRIVFEKRFPGSVTPDFFLVVLSSERFGMFDFNSENWRSSNTFVIAASHLRDRQEVMLLMKVNGWVASDIGIWMLHLNPELSAGALLQLTDGTQLERSCGTPKEAL